MRKRMGLILMLSGVALAVMVGLMMANISRRAAAARPQIKQVEVVFATQDIAQGTEIKAEMLVRKPYPAEFAPAAAVSRAQDMVGKFTASNVVKDQLMTSALVSTTKQAGNLSQSIPKGKVAFPLPKTDLLSANGAIEAGDKVDVLVTYKMKVSSRTGGEQSDSEWQTSQTTLQNLQVLDVGAGGSGGAGQGGSAAVVLLVSHQDAVTLALMKNSDSATVDLALRGTEDTGDKANTDGVTEDSTVVDFKFRKPQPIR